MIPPINCLDNLMYWIDAHVRHLNKKVELAQGAREFVAQHGDYTHVSDEFVTTYLTRLYEMSELDDDDFTNQLIIDLWEYFG